MRAGLDPHPTQISARVRAGLDPHPTQISARVRAGLDPHPTQIKELPPLKKRVEALLADAEDARKSAEAARNELRAVKGHWDQVMLGRELANPCRLSPQHFLCLHGPPCRQLHAV